jgi:hypothetical protein
MRKHPRRLVAVVLASLVLVAACSDTPSAPPAAVADQQPLQSHLVYDGNGAEYEFDTGNAACPAILNSHVKYWVPIHAVGQRLFTFFAPHVRIGACLTGHWDSGGGKVRIDPLLTTHALDGCFAEHIELLLG